MKGGKKLSRLFFYLILLIHKQLLHVIIHFTFTISNSAWKKESYKGQWRNKCHIDSILKP